MQSVHDDPPRLDRGPLPPLVVEGRSPDERHHQDPLGSHQLAVVVLGLGGPGQEGRDLACFGGFGLEQGRIEKEKEKEKSEFLKL